MNPAVHGVINAFFDALAVVGDVLGDPLRLRVLIANLGLDVELSATDLRDGIQQSRLGAIAADVKRIVNDSADLRSTLEKGSELEKIDAAVGLLEQARDIVDKIDSLKNIGAGDLSSFPPELREPAVWTELAEQLPGYLVVDYLQQKAPTVFGLLLAAKIIVRHNGAYRLNLPDLAGLLADPFGYLKDAYGWSRTFDYGNLLDNLADAIIGLNLPVRLVPMRQRFADSFFGGTPPDIRELDISLIRGFIPDLASLIHVGGIVVPVPSSPQGPVNGLYFTNLTWGSLSKPIDLGDGWSFEVEGTFDGTDCRGVAVFPDRIEPRVRDAAGTARMALSWKADASKDIFPWRVLGAGTGQRIEIHNLEISANFSTDENSGVEVVLRTADNGVTVITEPGQGDSFIRDLVKLPAIDTEFDLDIRLSPEGLFLGGVDGLNALINLDKRIGPLDIHWIDIGVENRDDGSVLIFAALSLSTELGPFAVVIEEIGLGVALRENTTKKGTFGPIDLDIALKPPRGLGFSLATDVVSGGGYLSIDPEGGEYFGTLELDILGIGVSAVGALTTTQPDGGDGWSLYLNLTVGLGTIPLGFGFNLTKVGGLVALNRTYDSDALADGIKMGALDLIMFPEDPIASALDIIEAAESYFPPQPDNYVFGPMLEITWGVPTIIAGQIGVIISLPEFKLAILGSLSVELPEAEPQLELHMDVLGEIDFVEGTVVVVASIRDSWLIRTISVYGDMAMYASIAQNPFFLFSVGGYHPDFNPPSFLPAAVVNLNRMTAELEADDNVTLQLTHYFAITSNTLQLGASVLAEASAKIVGATYTACGWFSFNVLIVFKPFSFIADMTAGVSVRKKDKEIFGVLLTLLVEGPKPIYALGTAQFKFFGLKVKFRVEVGSNAKSQLPEPFRIEDALESAIQSDANWQSAKPAGIAQEVVILAQDETEDLRVRPDGHLDFRQNVVPLNRDIDVYGHYRPKAARRFELTGASVGGDKQAFTVIRDYFAPAQFNKMKDSRKLSAPSFELMDAGVSFGAAGIRIPNEAFASGVDLAHETYIIEGDEKTPALRKSSKQMNLKTAGSWRPFGISKPLATAPNFSIRDIEYISPVDSHSDGRDATDQPPGTAKGPTTQGSYTQIAERIKTTLPRTGVSGTPMARLTPIPSYLKPGVNIK